MLFGEGVGQAGWWKSFLRFREEPLFRPSKREGRWEVSAALNPPALQSCFQREKQESFTGTKEPAATALTLFRGSTL